MTSILIVEDEAITAMDIRERLSEFGYSVAGIASTGKEAILLAETLKPSLILMDIILKGDMDGTQAAEYISAQHHIPIVFLTAYSDQDTFNRAKLSSPYGYLTKPFEDRDLKIAIELSLFKNGTEMKILSAERRYRSVMENATCGIFIMDSNGLILESNNQIEKIFGCSRDKIVGKDFREFIMLSDKKYADIQFQKVLIEKKIDLSEWHIIQSDGNIRDVEFSAVYVDDEKFIFCILTDVSERNKLRTQALLSDKLATLGTLSAGIIHEINNPMTFVLANFHWMHENIDKEINLRGTKNSNFLNELNVVVNESIFGAKRIQDIISNLKSFARADQGELTSVDVNKVLDTAIHMAHSQFKNISNLEKNFSENIPQLLLNSGKLHQVFLNLIVNSAQAMDPKNFSDNIISVKTGIEQNRICVEISDTGKGIPPENLCKIFDPFFTTKPAGIGTGLGLSICHEIIHGLGGEINVCSAVGKGTTFMIYLPLNLITEKSVSPPLDTKTFSGKKILIVDDDPTILITLERMLGKGNYITKAEGGRVALELLVNEKSFDVIVSDLNMPDINGADLFRYLSKNNPKLAGHMLFTTGGSYSPSISEFISSIQNPCLEKPFTRKQLLDAIGGIIY